MQARWVIAQQRDEESAREKQKTQRLHVGVGGKAGKEENKQ